MKGLRLSDYLDHMHQAAGDAVGYLSGMDKEQFLADRRTQQAVVMNLIIIGEAAARISEKFPIFVEQTTTVPWRQMRGMRNRIAHGYFDINLDIVWATVQTALPALIGQLTPLMSNQ